MRLERLGQIEITVDGRPRPAVGWRIESDPEFLAMIPRELLARGEDPASGEMTLVLRVGPEHPAAERIEAMIEEMHVTWSGAPVSNAELARDAPPQVLPQGQDDPCLAVCRVYTCDGAGDLYYFEDPPPHRGVYFIGNMGVTMFDIAVSTDRRLYGISGGQLYLIDSCTAQVTLLGPSSLGNGLAADLATEGLFAQGPPLERIPIPQTTPEIVGGSCCGPPPEWCGPSSDITESNVDGRLYSYLSCAGCAGDTLVSIDAATGQVTEEVGCLYDFWTNEPHSDVTGLVFQPCACTFLVGFADSDFVIEAFPTLGWGIGYREPSFAGTFGFATVPFHLPCSQRPICDAAAEPPGCSTVQLHANAIDPDGDPLTLLWTTNCPDASFAPSAAVADPFVTVDAGCRTCTFDLVVDDGNGGTCNDSLDVAFGGEALVVDASVLVSCLWPPSHALVDVGLSATSTGGCGGPGGVELRVTSVTSDEATASEPGAGGPRWAPDALVDGLSVRLRAERSGGADGRVYLVTVSATDPCGNEGETVVEVHVPHDRSARPPGPRRGHAPPAPCPAIDSGTRHDATARN